MSALEQPVHIPWTMRLGGSFAMASVVVLVGCASSTEPEAGSTSSAIIAGEAAATATDFVVRLDIGASELCTGVLLTPNLVLTARHCVSVMRTNTECGTFLRLLPPQSIAVSIGVMGDQRVAHAMKTFVDDSKTGCSHDVALVQLDTEVTAPVAPVRLSKVAKGEAASTLGFGEDGKGVMTAGRYERRGLVVEAVGPSTERYTTRSGRNIPFTLPAGELVTGESTCFGDSGGPLLDATGAVIGVTSRGIDQQCLDRPTIFADVTSHAELVREAARLSGHALTEAIDPSAANPAAAVSTQQTGNASPPAVTPPDRDAGTPPTTPSASEANASTGGGCSTAPSTGRDGLLALVLAAAAVRLRRRRAPWSSARSSSR